MAAATWILAAAAWGAGAPEAAAVQEDPAGQRAASGQSGALTRVITVTLKQAKRLHDLGAVFIDVRSDEEWRLGRIKDARHVNFAKNFVQLKTLEGITRETPLVFYCAMPECKAGPYASAVSIEWGFENVFYFPPGYFAWLLQDYPVDMDAPSAVSSARARRR